MKSKEELEHDGFTNSGVSRFEDTVKEYSGALYSKSIGFGKMDKADDLSLEVTHDHVRKAAFAIAKSFGKEKVSAWMVVSQVAEYVLTAIAAFALGLLSKPWGTPLFVVASVLAGLLIAIRLTRSK